MKLKDLNNKIGHYIIQSEINKELSYSGSIQGKNIINKEKMQIE